MDHEGIKTYTGPKALTEYILNQSKHKANKKVGILFVQGILAGMYIAFGAVGYFKVAGSVADTGLGAFLGALVFPMGIIAILWMQAELFTSDTMVMIAVFDRRTKIQKIFGILGIILFSNMIGAIFVAWMSDIAGIYNANIMELIIHKAELKVSMPVDQLIVSGIFCNILVSTSVCLAYSSKDEITKVIVLWFGIVVFVLSSTEHVVANMYYLFMAYFGNASITLSEIFYNLFWVAIGNFIGGGLIVSGVNYLLAYKDIERKKI